MSARFPGALRLPATGEQVAQVVARRAAACVGADYANLALLNSSQDSLRVYHDIGLDAEIADRYVDVPLDAPYPLAAAAREHRVVLLPDLVSYGEEFPEILSDTAAAGFQASASLPLYRADGTPLGALGFAWVNPIPFDAKLEGALRAVAQLCTETVERAERYDAEHKLVVELQHRLLGAVPELAGIETFSRYIPATQVPSVGGDWYEGLLLGGSRMALVVGDVTGHGIVAAADMTLIRGMLSALLHAGVAISDVFGEVSGVLAQRKELFLATAALAVVDVAVDTLTFATAGHPSPLLRLPDGHVQTLGSANGPMIGIGRTRRVAHTAPFPVGAHLVMFTDGLVERRDRPADVGVAQAATHLATLSGRVKPDHLIDSLLEALVADTESEDDIAILVVERTA
jgi:serine phosphatase RsbU (regulator of sigma subunit)